MSRFHRVIHALPHSITNALYMMYRVRSLYFQDGMMTVHDASFQRDPLFQEAYRLAKSTGSFGSWETMWRTYICCWAALKGRDLDGDFVECGVNLGGYSRAVASYVRLDELDKKLWLLDTFDGLVQDQITAEEAAHGVKRGQYVECFERATHNFQGVENVRFIRGRIPDTLSQVASEAICYLSIDMNCVAPEIAAAEFFWERLSSGAVIVLDDYGWARHAEQRKAFDAFAMERAVPLLALPTGQGIIIKP